MLDNGKVSRRQILKTGATAGFGTMVISTGSKRGAAGKMSELPWNKFRDRYARKYGSGEAEAAIPLLKQAHRKVVDSELSMYGGGELFADMIVSSRNTPNFTKDILDYRATREAAFSEEPIYEKHERPPEANDMSQLYDHDEAECSIHPVIFGHNVSIRNSYGPPGSTNGSYVEFDDRDGRMEHTTALAFGGGALVQTEMFGLLLPDATEPHEFGTLVERTGLVRDGGRVAGSVYLYDYSSNSGSGQQEEVIAAGRQVDGVVNYSRTETLVEDVLYRVGVRVLGESQITASLNPLDYINNTIISGTIFGSDDSNNLGFFMVGDNFRVKDEDCIIANAN